MQVDDNSITGGTMGKGIRIVAVCAAIAGAALLQGCATMTTGGFVPSRASATNSNMVSHYDVLHMQVAPRTPHSTMTVTHQADLRDFRYY
jgi:hypothetical protein